MIDSYSFGVIEVDGKKYTSDVILYPDRVDERWWRREGHHLALEDIQGVLDCKPDAVVVGTGFVGAMRVSSEVRKELESRKIELVARKTGEATAVFNELSARKKVVGAFHLTC